jgi:hypothetical protein
MEGLSDQTNLCSEEERGNAATLSCQEINWAGVGDTLSAIDIGVNCIHIMILLGDSY